MAAVRPQRHPGYRPRPRITQDIDEIIEPNWREYIPDAVDRKNTNTRKMARCHWLNIINSLRTNEILTVESLELAKRLVLERIRFALACSLYFRQGMEMFDDRLERKRL